MTSGEHPEKGDILVMVGTRKGVFLFWSDESRRDWKRAQHHMGWSGHAVNYDARNNAILAAVNSDVFGGLVQKSMDGGRSWEHFNKGIDFPAEEERRVRQIWQVEPGHASRPNELWAGTREAGLFRSSDGGAHWEGVPGLNNRNVQDGWEPGGGGLILHTIIPDPANDQRLYAAISTGGAYRSDDGGATFKPINKNVLACYMANPYPETGQCVHKIALHPSRPDVLFQQNHCGVYRSMDAGENWTDIVGDLPSRFGFPIAVHPHDPRTIYVVPLISDDRRVSPDGQMQLWRSHDDGDTWHPLTNGLPADSYLTILREGLATDDCEDAGLYVGTTGGQVFYSRDAGDSWEVLADFLPSVQSVSAARVVG